MMLLLSYSKIKSSNQVWGQDLTNSRIAMPYNEVYLRVNKGLLRLFLVLFIFLVSYPGGYCFAEISDIRPNQQETVIKTPPPFFSTVKIRAHAPLLTYAHYGQAKALWAGGHDFAAFDFSSVCRTLFLQNKPAVVHKLQFAGKILFPFHFFW